MKIGTAPASTTTHVCWDVPLAIFVKAQAASNYNIFIPNIYYFICNYIVYFKNDLQLTNLQCTISIILQKFNEFRYNSSFYNFIYRWVWFSGQHFSKFLCSCQLNFRLKTVQFLHHFEYNNRGFLQQKRKMFK